MKCYVLDTSALLCYLRDEPGADAVYRLIQKKSNHILMHRVNLGELYYGILKRDGETLANTVYGAVIQYPVRYLDDLSDRFLLTVARFKVNHRLGYADAYAAATAFLEQAALVTKDNDFRPLHKDKVVDVVWIE